MRCFFTIGLWLIIFTSPAFAQNSDSLKLIDEIRHTSSEDLTARMEVFGFQLMKNPTVKGFIVIYRDESLPIGFPVRLSARLQNYLTQIYKLPAERFEIMNG